MSEKRDLWVPGLLLLAGILVLVLNLTGETGSRVAGLLAVSLGLVGALACLPVRLRQGQGRVMVFALGVLLLIVPLVPGTVSGIPSGLGWVLAALALIAPLKSLPIEARMAMLGAAGLFAVLGVMAALGVVVPRSLLALFLGAAFFMAVQVLAARERVVEPEPEGPLVCVFGGSFDPFHAGHRALCKAAIAVNDRLLVVVAGAAPHKFADEPGAASDKTPFHHRVAMTRLGVEGLPRTEVLEMEGRRAGPSYTVDTLAVLVRSAAPGTRFRLLVGADMYQDFPHWKDSDRILSMASLLVARRPGFDLDPPAELADRDVPVEFLELPELAVSSREIRQTYREGGEPPAEALGRQIRTYIEDHGLYGKERARRG